MGLLEFDFQKADAQIRELKDIAARVGGLADSEYAGALQQLSRAWKGAGADAYLKKAAILQQRIKDTSRELQQSAEVFGSAAASVKAAEERATAIAVRKTKG